MPRCGGLLYIGETCSRCVAPASCIIVRQRDRLLRVVRSRAGDDGHAPPHLLHGDLHDAAMLGERHRRRFAGGAARDDEVDALVDLPVDEAAQRAFVDRAPVRERRGERGAAAH